MLSADRSIRVVGFMSEGVSTTAPSIHGILYAINVAENVHNEVYYICPAGCGVAAAISS